MHDGTVADGNSWLQTNLAPVLSSAWYTNYTSTVIVTMDENDAQSSGGCCGDAVGGRDVSSVVPRERAAWGVARRERRWRA